MQLHRATLRALLGLIVLAACGEEKPGPEAEPQRAGRRVASFTRQSVPELGRLVPADAVAVFVLAPAAELEPKRDGFVAEVAPEAGRLPLLAQVLAASGTAAEDVDPARPLALAMTLNERNDPLPTFILPAKGGGYVAKGHAAPAAATPPPLARDLPGGDLAFRIDLARLLPAFRPMIDPYLSADALVAQDPALARDPSTRAMIDAMCAWARTLLDSAGRLEGAMALDGGAIDFRFALAVKEGNALDVPPVKGGASFPDLAKSIDAERCAMTMLFRGDWAKWNEMLLPLYRSLYRDLPDGEARLERWLAQYGKVYEAMGPSLAIGVDFGADGMRLAGALRPADPAAYLGLYREAIVEGSAPELGMTTGLGGPAEVDGVKLDTYRLDLDWKKLMSAGGAEVPPGVAELARELVNAMFPRGGIRFAQGAVGDHVIMVMPAADGSYAPAVNTAKQRSGALPPAAAAALADDTTFLVHVDLRRCKAGITALMAKAMPELDVRPTPTGPPVDIWIRAGRTGRTYTFAAHVDVGGAVKLFRGMR